MRESGWLDSTRESYDTVADSYAESVRGAVAGDPFLRGLFGLFAELVRAGGDGSIGDIGCGPGESRRTSILWVSVPLVSISRRG